VEDFKNPRKPFTKSFRESEDYLNLFFLRQGLDSYQTLLEEICPKGRKCSEIYFVDEEGMANPIKKGKDSALPLMLLHFFDDAEQEEIDFRASFIERALLF